MCVQLVKAGFSFDATDAKNAADREAADAKWAAQFELLKKCELPALARTASDLTAAAAAAGTRPSTTGCPSSQRTGLCTTGAQTSASPSAA